MKQIFTSRILRKVVMLSFLVVGLAFVVSSGDNAQPVRAAAPCCSECPGAGDMEMGDQYCLDQCGGFNTCFYNCRNGVVGCNAYCVDCNNNTQCGACYADWQCASGECNGSGPYNAGYCLCP
jgi:hypothetical protein